MDDLALAVGPVSPPEWFIAFQRHSPIPWVNRLVPGRYKHVRCFGQLPSVRGWLFYELAINRTQIAVVPDAHADAFIEKAIADAGVVVRFVPPIAIPGWHIKPAFLCVSAVAHITGVPSCALRPDTFLRDCLRAGAEKVIPVDELQHQARPAPDAGTGDGQE